MIEQELMDKMVRELFILPDQAKRAIAIIKEAGYVAPEEIERQEQRFVEAEKILNREAAFEERRLHDEVE